ncbi:conserved hypothetical protein [Echinococcus multilocularis]|uniref:Uncharacterized protein n=1 Tax=Echinococcus multilocularis TaxID=6211 RepID=A0A068Y831_ECHMU|nr:conserved hypothetical protein [Echinococcus multilocularis]
MALKTMKRVYSMHLLINTFLDLKMSDLIIYVTEKALSIEEKEKTPLSSPINTILPDQEKKMELGKKGTKVLHTVLRLPDDERRHITRVEYVFSTEKVSELLAWHKNPAYPARHKRAKSNYASGASLMLRDKAPSYYSSIS